VRAAQKPIAPPMVLVRMSRSVASRPCAMNTCAVSIESETAKHKKTAFRRLKPLRLRPTPSGTKSSVFSRMSTPARSPQTRQKCESKGDDDACPGRSVSHAIAARLERTKANPNRRRCVLSGMSNGSRKSQCQRETHTIDDYGPTGVLVSSRQSVVPRHLQPGAAKRKRTTMSIVDKFAACT
jgi:hypothetical protein